MSARNRLQTLTILVVAAVALCLASCGGSKVNKANYDRIKTGMTEAEVEAILGKGEEKASAGVGMPGLNVQVPGGGAGGNVGLPPLALPNLKTKVWQDGSKTITVIFTDGKVAMQAQNGL